MFALYKKEIQFYLNNPIGYIVIILFGVFANFLFVKDIFIYGTASLRPFFDILPWLLMVFVPAVAMRAIAEEKRTNTLEVLLSLPLSETQIVLSKFLAMLTIIGIGLSLTLSLPLSLYMLVTASGSRIYIPELIIGYFGQLLMAGAFLTLSMFYSSQGKNQIVAFLLSITTIFFLIVFSTDFVATFLPKIIQDALVYLSPVTHVSGFVKGVVDIRSIYYFISFMVVWFMLTIIDLERRA